MIRHPVRHRVGTGHGRHSIRALAVATLAVVCLASPSLGAQAVADTAARDGQRDFDWNIGRWRTHLRRLDAPLTGSNRWVEYEGTSVVRPLLSGDANIVELEVSGPAGRIEGILLRLYDRQARQWTMHYASRRGGQLAAPLIGEFREGRGEFVAQEVYNGRTILVRFVITRPAADTATFEQSFSADGGRTWELNWVAVDTRLPGDH